MQDLFWIIYIKKNKTNNDNKNPKLQHKSGAGIKHWRMP